MQSGHYRNPAAFTLFPDLLSISVALLLANFE
jgi:hypothetical protein